MRMLMSEFLERVPECTDGDYHDANALYMALPNMDKDDFCRLYRAEVVLELSIFEKLRVVLDRYEEWVKHKPYFVESVPGVHTLDVTKKIQSSLLCKLDQFYSIFGKGEQE